MKKSDTPVVIEDTFNTSIENVWNAITKLDEMKLWYFDNIDAFEPVLGTKSKFAVQSGERTFTHLWEITEVEAPYKFSYNWKYEEYPGDSFVSFELLEDKGQTNLKLTVIVTEEFPTDIPEFKRESCVEGWKYFICWRLVEYLKNCE